MRATRNRQNLYDCPFHGIALLTRSSLAIVGLCWTPLLHAAGVESPTAAAAARPLPKFEVIARTVELHLLGLPGYEPGNLIARSDVAPVFTQLERMGWVPPDLKAILAQLPEDNDFVVQQLRREAGMAFMRRVRHFPLAYDRLYRLSALPGGRQLVADLIDGRGGEQFLQYLTTSQGGHNLGRMIERTPKGVDFNRPVDKIVTADRLILRLKQSYDQTRLKSEASRDGGASGSVTQSASATEN